MPCAVAVPAAARGGRAEWLSGCTLGGTQPTRTGAQNGFRRRGGTGTFLQVISINNNGQIVGRVFIGGTSEGFLYSNRTITSLGSFPAASINDNGVMVGGPSIDTGGTVQNLNTLIPAGSGYQIQNATAINDNGQIVANTTNNQALLLTPS